MFDVSRGGPFEVMELDNFLNTLARRRLEMIVAQTFSSEFMLTECTASTVCNLLLKG
jgi:hypothetical protein